MELNKFLDEQEEVTQAGFVVDTDEKANWALRKIKQFKEQQKENNALADAEIEKINAWAKQENEKAQQSIDYFQGLIAAFALKKRETDPKFKSMKLPNGRIRFKKQQPKWNYDDEKVVKALKDAGLQDFIKVKESPSKTDIKKAFDVQDGKVVVPDTGEILDGVEVIEQEDKFEVLPE